MENPVKLHHGFMADYNMVILYRIKTREQLAVDNMACSELQTAVLSVTVLRRREFLTTLHMYTV